MGRKSNAIQFNVVSFVDLTVTEADVGRLFLQELKSG